MMILKQWRCSKCHGNLLYGGVKRISKTNGVAGGCRCCNEPVDVYAADACDPQMPPMDTSAIDLLEIAES